MCRHTTWFYEPAIHAWHTHSCMTDGIRCSCSPLVCYSLHGLSLSLSHAGSRWQSFLGADCHVCHLTIRFVVFFLSPFSSLHFPLMFQLITLVHTSEFIVFSDLLYAIRVTFHCVCIWNCSSVKYLYSIDTMNRWCSSCDVVYDSTILFFLKLAWTSLRVLLPHLLPRCQHRLVLWAYVCF